MNQRELSAVLFAALGVFIAASAIPTVFTYAAILTQWDPAAVDPTIPGAEKIFSVIALAASLLAVVVGGLLVLTRNILACRLFPASSAPLAVPEALSISFAVVGCYLAVTGASQLTWGGQVNWGELIQAILGVGLFFGARGLSRIWAAARGVGRARQDRERAV